MAMAINRHDDDDASISSEAADSYERATAFLSGWIATNSLLVPPARATRSPPPQRRPFSQSLSDVPLPTTGLRRRRITVSGDDNISSLVNSLQTSIMLQEQNRPMQHRSRATRPNVSPMCVGRVLQGRTAFPPLPFSIRPQQPSTSSPANPPDSDRQRGGLPSVRSASAAPSRLSHADPSSSYRRSSSGDRRRSSCDDSPSEDVKNKHESNKHRSKVAIKAAEATEDLPPSRKSGGERRRSSSTSNCLSKTKPARKKSRRNTIDTEGGPSTSMNKSSSSANKPSSLDRLNELDGPNFHLGDTFRSPKYQVIEPNPTKATHLVKQLRIHDFAWIRRSSHEWTYGIVADFPIPKHGDEPSIRFVIDKMGNTKTFKMKYWAKCIRLVDDKSQPETR